MSDEADLSVEQALAQLPPGEVKIHTFLDAGQMLIGAHWDRSDIEELIRSTPHRRRTGEAAQSMGHGIALWDHEHWVFVETATPA
jgi:hypothetical protein